MLSEIEKHLVKEAILELPIERDVSFVKSHIDQLTRLVINETLSEEEYWVNINFYLDLIKVNYQPDSIESIVFLYKKLKPYLNWFKLRYVVNKFREAYPTWQEITKDITQYAKNKLWNRSKLQLTPQQGRQRSR